MKKEIFINESMGETRIAIQEDSKLVEVYVEQQDNQHHLATYPTPPEFAQMQGNTISFLQDPLHLQSTAF